MKKLTVLALLYVGLSACDRPQYALGSLEWDRVNGRAIASEAITELYVTEGEQVKQGQALLKLDSGLQQSKVIQTQARLEQLQWQLNELKAGYRVEQIAAAEAEHTAAVSARKNRAVEYRRLSELIVNKLTSQRNLDLARTALDQAVGKEEAALERLTELKAGYRTEQIAAAEAEFEAEQAVLSYEKQLLERYTVVAERDGVLESFPFKLGDKPPALSLIHI